MHRHGHSPLNDAPTPSLDVKLIDLWVQITISVVLLQGKEELRLFPTWPHLRGCLFWWCCMSPVQINSFFLKPSNRFLEEMHQNEGKLNKKVKKKNPLCWHFVQQLKTSRTPGKWCGMGKWVEKRDKYFYCKKWVQFYFHYSWAN